MLTALIIATNESVKPSWALDKESGLYRGLIVYRETERLLINTVPHYKSEQEALDAMQDMIDRCKAYVETQMGQEQADAK